MSEQEIHLQIVTYFETVDVLILPVDLARVGVVTVEGRGVMSVVVGDIVVLIDDIEVVVDDGAFVVDVGVTILDARVVKADVPACDVCFDVDMT